MLSGSAIRQAIQVGDLKIIDSEKRILSIGETGVDLHVGRAISRWKLEMLGIPGFEDGLKLEHVERGLLKEVWAKMFFERLEEQDGYVTIRPAV